jgi:uncharacterized protein YprB with RNaseH-like and TPR domain
MDIKKRIEKLRRDINNREMGIKKNEDSMTVDKLRILLREKEKSSKRIKDITKLADYLGGEVCTNAHGKFILKTELLESQSCNDDLERIHILAKEDIFKNFNLSHNIFLDVETSGLSSGVGNFAFLIGIGFIEKRGFKIIQFFLPDLPCEKSLLVELTKYLEDFRFITTFNGKSFDIPLLNARFKLQMLNPPDFDLHLDLLHIARRVYKRSFSDRSLASLEEKLLSQPRLNDIAGHLIPDVYFNFLRTNEVSLLSKVIKHNIIDVLSMFKLLSHFSELLKTVATIKNPEVLYSISKLLIELRDNDTSIQLMKRALRFTENIPLIFEIKRDLSILYKRLSQWEEASELWTELLSETPHEPFPYIELAKYYEHRVGDYKKAKDTINTLKEKLGNGWEYLAYDNLLKRERRLNRKIDKFS